MIWVVFENKNTHFLTLPSQNNLSSKFSICVTSRLGNNKLFIFIMHLFPRPDPILSTRLMMVFIAKRIVKIGWLHIFFTLFPAVSTTSTVVFEFLLLIKKLSTSGILWTSISPCQHLILLFCFCKSKIHGKCIKHCCKIFTASRFPVLSQKSWVSCLCR